MKGSFVLLLAIFALCRASTQYSHADTLTKSFVDNGSRKSVLTSLNNGFTARPEFLSARFIFSKLHKQNNLFRRYRRKSNLHRRRINNGARTQVARLRLRENRLFNKYRRQRNRLTAQKRRFINKGRGLFRIRKGRTRGIFPLRSGGERGLFLLRNRGERRLFRLSNGKARGLFRLRKRGLFRLRNERERGLSRLRNGRARGLFRLRNERERGLSRLRKRGLFRLRNGRRRQSVAKRIIRRKRRLPLFFRYPRKRNARPILRRRALHPLDDLRIHVHRKNRRFLNHRRRRNHRLISCTSKRGLQCVQSCASSGGRSIRGFACPDGLQCCAPPPCQYRCDDRCNDGAVEMNNYYCFGGLTCCKPQTQTSSLSPTPTPTTSVTPTASPSVSLSPSLSETEETTMEEKPSGEEICSDYDGKCKASSCGEDEDKDDTLKCDGNKVCCVAGDTEPTKCEGDYYKCAEIGKCNGSVVDLEGCSGTEQCCEIEACTELYDGKCKTKCDEGESSEDECTTGGKCCVNENLFAAGDDAFLEESGEPEVDE